MSRRSARAVITKSKLGGLKQLSSGKQIEPTDLTDCDNVQQRGGRISPRPGLVKAIDYSFNAVTTLQTATLPSRPFEYLDVDVANSRVYFTDRFSSSGWSTIYRCTTSGASLATTEAATFAIKGIALRVATSHIFVTSSTTIKRTALDGTDSSGWTSILTGLTAARGLVVDNANSLIYFCDGTTIKRCTTVGGSLTTLVSGLTDPEDIDVDVSAGKLYFSDRTPGQIKRCNTDGTSLETLYTEPDGEAISVSLDASGTTKYVYVSVGVDAGLGTTAYRVRRLPVGSDSAQDVLTADVGSTGPALSHDNTNGVLYMATRESLRSISTNVSTISMFPWRRSLLGASNTSFTDDLILLQLLRTNSGGSDFKVYFPSRTTTPDHIFNLTPGYTAASSSNPASFVMTTRTANPSASDPIIPVGNYGRAAFAATGYGFDTNQGGVRMCAGSGGFMFNYHAGDSAASEQQLLYIVGSPTGGTFKLTFGGQETGNITFSATAGTMASNIQTALLALSNVGSGQLTVATTTFPNIYQSGGPAPYNITFAGTLANTGLPLVYMSSNSLSGGEAEQVIVRRTTKGQSYADGLLTLIPSGLPSPTITAQISSSTGANLTGAFRWVMTYVSSTYGWESPPSEYRGLTGMGADSATISWTNPSTLYFNDYFSATSVPFGPVIDKVRIYRKRTGSNTEDGVGADLDYYLVAEVQANRGQYRDNVLDSARTSDIAPMWKNYPPSDANYVKIVSDVAYWAAGGNNKAVWNSEKTKVGGIDDGEFGYDYVADNSYTIVADDSPSDHGITALGRLANMLVVFTDEAAYAADASSVDELGIAFRRIEGAAGCASHWCVTETNPLAGDEIQGGLLLYAHPKGGMYAFNGATSDPIARDDIYEELQELSPKTWQDTSTGFGSIVSWYYATAILDPEGNRVLLAAPLTDGGSIVLVYDLDTRKWLKWTINKLAWCVGREWDDDSDLYGRPVVLCTDGASIFKLVDGMADDGADFDWFAQFGNWDCGNALKTKMVYSLTSIFDIIEYGSSPTVSLSAYLDDRTSPTVSRSGSLSGTNHFMLAVKARARHVAMRVSGTQSDDMDHAALVGFGAEVAPVGLRLE